MKDIIQRCVILIGIFIFGEGEAVIKDEVIATLAGLTALEVSGVAGIPLEVITGVPKLLPKSQVGKMVKVSVKDDRLMIHLPLVIYYSYPILKVAENVKTRIKEKIKDEFGLEVIEVDILVKGIQIPHKKRGEENKEELLTISKEAISTIAGVATLEIEGVVGVPEEVVAGVPKILARSQVSKAIDIEIEDKRIKEVKIPVVAFEGIDKEGLVREIQSNVKEKIERLTNLEVLKVSVEIKGVKPPFKREKGEETERGVIREEVEKPQKIERETKIIEGVTREESKVDERLKRIEEEMEELKELLSNLKERVEKSRIDPAKEMFKRAEIFFEKARKAIDRRDYDLALKFIERAKEWALQAMKITKLKEYQQNNAR